MVIAIVLVSTARPLAQSGGSFGFQALNLVNNARTAALGGYNVSLADGDLALFFQNPALLDSVRAGDLVAMYNPFFVDINAFTAQYTAKIPALGTMGMGITYLDYGTFDQTDATGAESGTFQARDFLVVLGKAHQVGPFTLGANVKYIHSGISGFSSSALLLDLGGIYKVPSTGLSAGMAISNVGVIRADVPADLPLQVTTGLTFQPEGMPVRFTLTAHNFTDGEDKFFDADKNPNVADVVFKRVSVGGEILFSPNVHFLLGYDHNRKRELRLRETGGGSGFSYGVMIRINRYTFRFSRTTYHAAGGTSFISVQTNVKEFRKLF